MANMVKSSKRWFCFLHAIFSTGWSSGLWLQTGVFFPQLAFSRVVIKIAWKRLVWIKCFRLRWWFQEYLFQEYLFVDNPSCCSNIMFRHPKLGETWMLTIQCCFFEITSLLDDKNSSTEFLRSSRSPGPRMLGSSHRAELRRLQRTTLLVLGATAAAAALRHVERIFGPKKKVKILGLSPAENRKVRCWKKEVVVVLSYIFVVLCTRWYVLFCVYFQLLDVEIHLVDFGFLPRLWKKRWWK